MPIKKILSYKSFIFGSVRREFQARCKNSVFGVAWLVLSPLTTILVYLLVFSQVMNSRLDGVAGGGSYAVYLCVGVLAWGFFVDLVTKGISVFVDNANFLNKVSFPRSTLPMIIILTAGINFSIGFLIFNVVLLLIGNSPGWVLVSVLPVIIAEVLLGAGLGMTLGVLNVFFRDIGQMFSLFLQLWFWMTPIVYPISILPEYARKLVLLNPVYPIISSYQNIFVLAKQPDWLPLLSSLMIGVALCTIAYLLYRKNVGELMDAL